MLIYGGVSMKNTDNAYDNTLFLALTRPSMIMGVTMDAFFINIIVAFCIFILSKNVFFLLIWVPLHVICLLLCRMDKHIFSLLLGSVRLKKAANKKLWKGVSYEPY